MNLLKLSLTTMLLICLISLKAQSGITYSIRGNVIDQDINQPIFNALVHVVGFESAATVTDEFGDFVIQGIPLGRNTLVVTYLGYESYSTAFEVKSGKELILQIGLHESIEQLDEVVVTAHSDKTKALNTMSYASTRTFSVEESSRFAGAVDDPARMAQSFAGVIPTNDGNNYISIRGNHPSALLYRMEGIDIPNPNHFGDVASSGGGVSVLSSQMLSNSDFSTGAFSAEYGNALGGVFDLKLRKGNNTKTEYTFKAGFLGLEAAIEGPFSKNYKGSYLVNYRYSTLSLIDKLGVDLAGVLNYSDLSYNVFLPMKYNSALSFFGVNGWSSQEVDEGLEDHEDIPGALRHSYMAEFLSDMSINGVKYVMPIKKNGYVSAIAAYGTTVSGYNEDILTSYPEYEYFNKFDVQNTSDKISLALNYTQKLKPGMTLRTGAYLDRLGYNMSYDRYSDRNTFYNIINNRDQANLARGFVQLQYALNKKWETNLGLHYTNFLLNNTQALEFRGNILYKINERSDLAFAYGGHSQVQPLIIYYVKSQDGTALNKELDLSRAQHFVLTHNFNINRHTRLKTEIYHQALSSIPVGQGANSNYSQINQQFFFEDFQLVSEGKGRNTGIELTLERFLHNNWYYLVTGSVFDSKYKTPTSDWINARFNVGYTSVISFGKEWNVGRSKQNVLGLNIKNAIVGGQWDTPIDRQASQAQKVIVRDESRPFSQRLSAFYKLDVGLRYKVNKKRLTSTLALDLMNATNHKNVGGLTYDIHNDKETEWATMPFVPVLSYKLEF